MADAVIMREWARKGQSWGRSGRRRRL